MSTQTTQQSLPIAHIGNNIVITKNAEIRAILEVSPINFALKSQDDQTALIGQFQNFVNALHFPIQILIQSRGLNVYPYIRGLEQQVEKEQNELLLLQGREYIAFIKKLVELAKVMEKKFYVIIPLVHKPVDKKHLLGQIMKKKANDIHLTQEQLTKFKQELQEKISVVANSLNTMEIQTKRLNTQEIIELYYNIYNPEEASEEKLTNVEELEAPIIKQQVNEPAADNPTEKSAMQTTFNPRSVDNQPGQQDKTTLTEPKPKPQPTAADEHPKPTNDGAPQPTAAPSPVNNSANQEPVKIKMPVPPVNIAPDVAPAPPTQPPVNIAPDVAPAPPTQPNFPLSPPANLDASTQPPQPPAAPSQ